MDYVIAGTGYTGDLAARPELRDFAGKIMRWCDRYTPPAGEEDAALGLYPYLGSGHELMERVPGAEPMLRHIHVQNPSGFVSFGLPTGDVPCMKRDIPVITGHISADFFQMDLDPMRRRMVGDVPPALREEMYRSAVR